MSINILGVMTGTSCDGLDAACLKIDPQGWTPLWSASLPYPDKLRKSVLTFQTPGSRFSTKEWLELNRDLGDWYGAALNKLIKKQKQTPHLIANHGQTVAHFPQKKSKGMTLQLGDPSRIATATGISVASNFRDGDMAAGGQGAPLVPLFHQMLASNLNDGEAGVSIHNIGGISNLSYFGPKGKLLGFDTGPGNIWIDAAAEKVSQGKQKIDWGGKIALRGKIDAFSVEKILKHPYFLKSAPKSTGRDEFPISLFHSQIRLKGPALVATATEITVESIARAYESQIIDKRLPLNKIIICGGGAKNPTLLNRLRIRLPKVSLSTFSEWGLDSQYIEAQAFAYFGYLTLLGIPVGGSWTGSKQFGPPGHLIPGKNWTLLMKKLALFQTG
jgi:anhydro-N-acetylmuramic acid kinase